MNQFWYKDAIIYQLHVKAFYDSNADGYGDFAGLIEKLDYIQDLGVDCLWLMPFYPSPLRDDGYDISDYRAINPAYGDRRDFHNFMREAHRRGIKVITELVINHTSDEHPWFQAARRAPSGTDKRNWYVWSDTDQKYKDARIIFLDTEKSNWTWDPVAKAFFWHRFFHHQPDLNFDNPSVFKAILRVMRFWLDLGVDGLRLDAIPYLIEREGTDCENLAETHDVIRRLRKALDEHYENRIFLAEANQWPTDVSQYFAHGDECHMAYHFPLMPRIFMALHQEDRHPITEILRQMPEIPESCQWAIFLRNHDELTLEMVTDAERDYMYSAYAQDPMMRINLGIRRRLAPLLQHSRERIELLNSLLFSLPGTPIIYYGDEIGMGENIFLGDRDGVRTPMQWSADRNAGFSRAPFAQLYSAPIMDPVTGYESVNVEAQTLDPSSLLNWMKTIIKLRKNHKVFGRGELEIVAADNRKVLSFIRKYEDETVLVVANLSRYPQSVMLDLPEYRGVKPVEMFGLGNFHAIDDKPYVLTLGPYAFYWLLLKLSSESLPVSAAVPSPQKSSSRVAKAPAPPRMVVKELAGGWPSLMSGTMRKEMETGIFPRFMQQQGWLSGRSKDILSVRIRDWTEVQDVPDPTAIFMVEVQYESTSPELYSLTLSLAERDFADRLLKHSPGAVLAELYDGRIKRCAIYMSAESDEFCRRLMNMISGKRILETTQGALSVDLSPSWQDFKDMDVANQPVRRLRTEQGDLVINYGSRVRLKLYRRMQPGASKDFEMGRFFHELTDFRNVPAPLGMIEYRNKSDAAQFSIGYLQESVPNQGDGWTYSVEELRRYFERAATHPYLLEKIDPEGSSADEILAEEIPIEVYELQGIFIRELSSLGARTAEMHVAINQLKAGEKFTVMNAPEIAEFAAGIEAEVAAALDALASSADKLSEDTGRLAEQLSANRVGLINMCRSLTSLNFKPISARGHGDLRLQSVLYSSGDFYIVDFAESNNKQGLQKATPLLDLASMLVSLSEAVYSGLFLFTHNRPDDFERFLPWARVCQLWTAVSFLKGYLRACAGTDFVAGERKDFVTALRTIAFGIASARISRLLPANAERAQTLLISMVPYLQADLFSGEGNK